MSLQKLDQPDLNLPKHEALREDYEKTFPSNAGQDARQSFVDEAQSLYEHWRKPQLSGINEPTERFATGDVLKTGKDGQTLTMPNGDVLKENKKGEIDLQAKMGNETVDVKVKDGAVIVKRPHEKEERYPAQPGVRLLDLGLTVSQKNGLTTFDYENGNRVTCDKEGVLDIRRGNQEVSFGRLTSFAPANPSDGQVPPIRENKNHPSATDGQVPPPIDKNKNQLQ